MWSARRDSNPRRLAPKASALPGCATRRNGVQIHRLYRTPRYNYYLASTNL